MRMLWAAALAVTAAPSPPPLPAGELVKRIDAFVQPFVEDGHLSGTVLVARGDEVVYERSFGMADYELRVPNTAQTRFGVASIAKPVTIMLVGQLVEARKLALADPLEKWIPGFPSGDKITVDHLLNHRAGIPHRVTEEGEEARPRTAAEMVELARRRPLLFAPGERSSYSSGGYSVLTRVLELASGESYSQLLAERIVKPAGLTATAHPSGRALMPDRAPSYLAGPEGPRRADLKHLSFLVGAGSLYSTPRDLFRLLGAARAGKLGEAARESVVARPKVAWNGSTNGYRAFVDSDPATGITVIVASNLMTGALDRLQADLPRLAAGEALPAPERLAVRPVAMDPALLARYAGTYEFSPGTTFEVTVDGAGLDASGRILVPTSPTTFFSYADYGTVTLVLRPDGSVERLDWSLAGSRNLSMPRR
jgi:CubicO group peptidase (beta-lactamase class C family)